MLLKPVAENLQCIYTKVYRSLELFGSLICSHEEINIWIFFE